MFAKYKDQKIDDVVFQVATFADGSVAVKMPHQANVLNYESSDFNSKFETATKKQFDDFIIKFNQNKNKEERVPNPINQEPNVESSEA